MTEPILVTGGTGTLGRQVVPHLVAAGHAVRVFSRHGGQPAEGVEHLTGDLLTGDGLAAAVDGTRIVVHCAGGRTGDERAAANLVAAARQAGVGHLVLISVAGADRVPVTSRADRTMFGYFAAKRGAELAVTGSGLPWTTLRATQFHDLILATARMLTRLPVVPVVAGVRFQPVDAGEVAARLAGLALGRPAGLVPEMAGPRAYPMADLVRSYLRARGTRRLLVPVALPGGAARAVRSGANLPDGASLTTGSRTWEEFLSLNVSPAQRHRSGKAETLA